jgi:4-diphosphocytidyl-2-C-methyl-D-erythritol kinase
MVVFPNAKINLGLNILSKREDGYHNISSCFYPIDFFDILEVLPSKILSFQSSGISIPGSIEDNLCLKAFHLLEADHGIPPVQIHLHKNIPIGAGLGGGSADASFMLKSLNELFQLNISDLDLEKYAARLGSDCPFFIKNNPVIAEGTGNIFLPLKIDLKGLNMVLIYPNIHVSTKEAYSGILPNDSKQNLTELLKSDIYNWKEELKNDFEKSVFNQYPTIANLKKVLYENGALYASMTGSGSAFFGIFDSEIPSIKNTVWSGPLS